MPDVAPEQMYGPDDPAYGPPGPDWYKRGEERAATTADTARPADTGEQPATRGPFEPLRSGDAGYEPASDPAASDPAANDPEASGAAADDGQPSGETQETPEPDNLDFLGLDDTAADPEAGTLGQVKDLYLAVGRVSPDRLDRHFDQLLERQRKLISDYFTESSGLGFTESSGPGFKESSGPGADETPPPFGFDTAESLAGFRAGLRDARRPDLREAAK